MHAAGVDLVTYRFTNVTAPVMLNSTSCRRRPPQYAPAPLLPLWVAKRLAPPSRPRLQSADRDVAVGAHGQYVPTLTAAAA